MGIDLFCIASIWELSSAVRTRNVVSGEYSDPANLAVSRVPIQSVVTSGGQNDSGMFELAKHDERYLPFEGAGAVSRWRLTLPDEFRAFDYGTISDVVVHLRCTARDGGGTLAGLATGTLGDRLSALTRAQSTDIGLVQLIKVRADFAGEWRRFRDEGAHRGHYRDGTRPPAVAAVSHQPGGSCGPGHISVLSVRAVGGRHPGGVARRRTR